MKNLFVGNLSFRTTESELTALFKAIGEVTRVHVPRDRETSRARGFAFVEMPNDEEAAKAIAGLNGRELGGRALKLVEARAKPDHPPAHRNPGGGRRQGRFSTPPKTHFPLPMQMG